MNSRTVNNGRLYGVGVGPGDPELITLKAARVLTRVPVIFVPKKSSQSDSIAEAIIGSLESVDKDKIVSLVLPMLRDKAQLQAYWQQAAETIWQRLKAGKDAAFVNVGDPLLYGTFIHVMETLKKNHPEAQVTVIPGISSINAAAAGAVVPLAIDDERLAIIADDPGEEVIRQTLKNFDTVVFMKMNNIFHKLMDILREMDLLNSCVYARRCTTPDEEIISDISNLPEGKIDYFSLLIVRK